MRYRKKPVEVDAVFWRGNNWDEVMSWLDGLTRDIPIDSLHKNVQINRRDDTIKILTLEGVMDAPPGWWIIRGVQGEFYPCRADIFKKTYEEVDGHG